jgi:uncharacterized protein YkuJ
MVLVQLNGNGCFELFDIGHRNKFVKVGENVLTVKYNEKDEPFVVHNGSTQMVTFF